MRSILVTGGAGFIGSNVTLALQQKYPNAHIVVADDFRSGDFKNLRGFEGDFVAADVSRFDWRSQFKSIVFDSIFHFASITDTTVHDQRLQAHDNIESFRKLLEFVHSSPTTVVYASSAATYGRGLAPMQEAQSPAPENIYAFTKVQLDNMARRHTKLNPQSPIVGLRYFNVFGLREAHKQGAASMIYQLYMQMKANRRPRVFRAGEHKRDFVYIKDVIDLTIKAAEARTTGIFNCGSGTAISFNDVICALNACLGTALDPEYIENPHQLFYQAHTEADMTKTREELKFTAQWEPLSAITDYVELLKHKAEKEQSEPSDTGAPRRRPRFQVAI